MWRLTCRKAGVLCGRRQLSLWLQSEWDFMLSDTTKSVHLQVVYIFIEACCSTKKPMTKAMLHFQLLFSQPYNVNKTNFLTFKHGIIDRSKNSASTIEISKVTNIKSCDSLQPKPKKFTTDFAMTFLHTLKTKKINTDNIVLNDEANFHSSGHITVATLKCG
jgi:hypothetical protein